MIALESTEDCFANTVQDFLICTTVHKAKKTGVPTGETYVRVTLGKVSKNTKTYAASENPFFNEYFVFELRCTLTELLRYTIIYELRKRVACKKDQAISELLIDLQSLWNQPNRCFYKKWGRLETPIGVVTSHCRDANGYLQIDLVVVSEVNDANAPLPGIGEISRWQLHQDFDDIESNLLENVNKSKVKCNIRYAIFIYHANLTRKGDFLLQVSYAGNHGKTHVCKNTDIPIWNQEINFTWMYPSLAQIFLIQLFAQEHCCWKCLADYELHFDEIAFDATPKFGPTYVHLYGAGRPPDYVGRLLMEIRSECIELQLVRELIVRDAPPIMERSWWQEEAYTIEFIALQGYSLRTNVHSIKLSFKIAEHASDCLDCHLLAYATKPNQQENNLRYFLNKPPYRAIHIKIRLPDLLEKYDGDFFIQEMIEFLRDDLETFRVFQLKYNQEFVMQSKCLSAIMLAFCTKLREGIDGKRLQYHQTTERTQWDNNRNEYLERYFTRLHDRVRAARQKLRLPYMEFIEQEIEKVLMELQHIIIELSGLLQIIRVQDEWPELYLVMSSGTHTDIGICRVNAKYYVDVVPNPNIQRRLNCWKVKSFIFKDIQCQHTCINCGCIVGIVHGCLAIVADGSRRQFLGTALKQWKQTEQFYWSPAVTCTSFNCRIFVHQAKVRPSAENASNLCDARARVVFSANTIDTDLVKDSLSPIWNMVFSVDNLVFPGGISWYIENPPLLAVELFDLKCHGKEAFLGSAVFPVSIMNSALIAAVNNEEKELEEVNGLPPFEERGHMLKTKDAFQKFQVLKSTTPPPLKWVPISVNGSVRAELLISAELVATQRTGRLPPQCVCITQGIPVKIRPVMQNFVLEVVFVGFRNYKRSSCCACSERHRCKLMLGELVLKSGLTTTRLRQSMNFFIMYASGIVSLPCQLEYWPSMVVTDFTESTRGKETTIGASLIPDCRRFIKRNKRVRCCPSGSTVTDLSVDKYAIIPFEEDFHLEENDPLLKKQKRSGRMSRFFERVRRIFRWRRKAVDKCAPSSHDLCELNYNWWTKFYNSLYMDIAESPILVKHRLTVYYTEIEKMPEYDFFHDWAVPIKLVHGIKFKKNMHPREETYATLKLKVKLTPCPCGVTDSGEAGGDGSVLRPLAGALNTRYQKDVQSLAELCKITVRVYVVQCLNLRSVDKCILSDSYVRCQLGTATVSNRAHYVPNKSNPIFGACFQLEALLPREHLLEVSVFNRDNSHDDLIGSTVIDLEDRWRSRHRCTIGIAREYCSAGYNMWRDICTPLEILRGLCEKHAVAAPRFQGATIEVDGIVFTDQTQLAKGENLHERLSLTVLRNLEALPSFGYTLMPEHVETRTLYRNNIPGIPQGKIQLWIELYESNMNLPAMLDITPQPPQPYELRVTILGCANVGRLERGSIFRTNLSDVFVKGWCSAIDHAQTTDIHYRSLKGVSHFNWRMIFPLQYSNIEDMIVVKRKTGTLHELFEMKQPAILCLQILQDDEACHDNYLGMLELNLSHFPEPVAHAKQVQSYQTMYKQRKLVNLFERKTVKGWFPLKVPSEQMNMAGYTNGTTSSKNLGKIELELEMCTAAEAGINPRGLGREPPHPLTKPKRPDTNNKPWQRARNWLQKLLRPPRSKYLIITLILLLCGVGLALYLSPKPKYPYKKH